MKIILKALLLMGILASNSFAWVGGFGSGGGGGGSLTGTGISGRLTLWTGPTTLSSSLITSSAGDTGFLDNSLTLRLRVFMDGTPNPVIRPVSSELHIQESGGLDVIVLETGEPATLNLGVKLPPLAPGTVVVHVTDAKVFLDSATGEISVRKSTAGGGGVVSLEAGGTTATFEQKTFIPTLGQTVFSLTTAYVGAGGYSTMAVNNIGGYEEGINYTISGTVLTWLNTPFTLDGTDRVVSDHQTN